jgi:hypothetical protein
MKKIEELGRLMCIPADASKDDVKMRFVQIAEIIKNYCVIKFKNQKYRILDFEFYFYNRHHRDISVHPRKSDALCWYFNDFGGIDLNFKSDIDKEADNSLKYRLTENSYFGGILIRQIQNIKDGMVFDGPWKVAELFRVINATSQKQDNPILGMEHLEPISFMEPQKRCNLLGNHKGTDTEKAKAKADNNLKASFVGYSESDMIELEKQLVHFSECEYRYCWVKPK